MPQRGKFLYGAQSHSPAIFQSEGVGVSLQAPLWSQNDRKLMHPTLSLQFGMESRNTYF